MGLPGRMELKYESSKEVSERESVEQRRREELEENIIRREEQ